LVHVEVAETGLSGTDSRLYATGAPGLGATIGEALAMTASRMGDKAVVGTSYEIPCELLESTNIPVQSIHEIAQQNKAKLVQHAVDGINATVPDFVRGGYQGDENVFYSDSPGGVWGSNAWDDVRQSEYEQLHQQMYVEQQTLQQQQHNQQPLQQR
jgi:hypothetical protein